MKDTLTNVRRILEGMGYQHIPQGIHVATPNGFLNREILCQIGGTRGFFVSESTDELHALVEHITTCQCLALLKDVSEEGANRIWRGYLHLYAAALSPHGYQCQVVNRPGQAPVLLVLPPSVKEQTEALSLHKSIIDDIQGLIPEDF